MEKSVMKFLSIGAHFAEAVEAVVFRSNGFVSVHLYNSGFVRVLENLVSFAAAQAGVT